jgi:hypothetical protein
VTGSIPLPELLLDVRVLVVLDLGVGPAWQVGVGRDLGPPVARAARHYTKSLELEALCFFYTKTTLY